jgi:hypothetical protein
MEGDAQDAATRLSGLRNLLFSLGLKNLNRQGEPEGQEPEEPLSQEEVAARQAYARSYQPVQHPPVREYAGASPARVTAAPEFLPPQPEAEEPQQEHSWSNPSTSRRDRRDAYDEVQILPSWRGQYKKK